MRGEGDWVLFAHEFRVLFQIELKVHASSIDFSTGRKCLS